jgi:alpha-methylacyl-CoA racemase
LLQRLGLADRADLPKQFDTARWGELRAVFATTIKSKSRDAWEQVFAGSDACVAPILSLDEAPQHPHMAARQAIVTRDGVTQPAPAPRFSRTGSAIARAPVAAGTDTDDVLAALGYSAAGIAALKAKGAVGRG